MKKDPSNRSAGLGDFTLPKSTILRGRKNFDRLFRQQAIVFRGEHITIRFRTHSNADEGCKMGFIVKKKLGKAVRRNKMKRLLRESYRIHKHLITDLCIDLKLELHGVLMAQTLNVTFKEVESDVKNLLQLTRNHVISTEEEG